MDGSERYAQQPERRPALASEKFAVERKLFYIDLKENQRGRVFKITEDVGGRRDTILLPVKGARDFLEALRRLIQFEAKL
jgi:hypothetical protein